MSAATGPGTPVTGAPDMAAAPAGGPRTEPARPARDREPGRWLWPAAFVVAGILLFLCYLRLSGDASVTSDPASYSLQAWDMWHGNWLLSGWKLTDVTVYTTELPEYILVQVFRGLGPSDVHTAAAFTYTLLVVLAGLLAKGNKTGKEGLVRVLIASGIMIAPEVGHGTFLLLLAPDHFGTGVPLLLIFLLIDRAPRRWWVPPLVGLMFVWVQIGDRIAVTIGVAPLVAVCAVRAYQGIVQRREPARDYWYELLLAASAVVSAGVAEAVVKIISVLGGFAADPLRTTFAPSASWPGNLALTGEGLLGIFGADVTGRTLGFAAAVALLHLAGLALACWAACRVIRRFFRCDDLIAQVLVVAIVLNLGAYAFSKLPNTYWDNREITGVLTFGAVLAGRVLAADLMRARLLPALTAIACGYLIALGYGLTRPLVPTHDQALADWLTAHHLTAGLGSYAEGNSVKLDSHGAIQVSAPAWYPHAVRPGRHNARAADFDPRRYYANFVVTTTQDGPGFYLPPEWIIRAFGEPAHVYHYSVWTIMTWNKNLLDQVR